MFKVRSQSEDYKVKKASNQTLTQIAFEPIKEKLLSYLKSSDFKKLEYLVRIEREIYPFATAGCFYPKIIDEGNSSMVFVKEEGELIFPCIMVSIIPDEFKRTLIIISCLKDDLNSSFYLKKLGSMKDTEEFNRAISGIILNTCSSNTFLNPQFWDKLCLNDEDKLIAREVSKKRPLDKLYEKPYLSSINLFDKKNAIKPPTSHL